jgi:hypothetical protein
MKKNKILLVEGNDDMHVVKALCQKFNLPELFDVEDCKGIENILKRIPGQFKVPEIETVGIIVDADINLQNRWNSLKNELSKIGFNMPDNISENGLININETQKVGVWLMPNNNANGMLEDFISFLVPKDDKLLQLVDTALNNIEKQKLNKYLSIHKSKAKIHTWLAWQEDPGTPMGQGITKRYLSTDEEICKKFVDWLTELFK